MTNPSKKNAKKAASEKSSGKREVNRLKASEAIMRDAREFSESIVETVREPLLVLDELLRVVLANRAFYTVFKARPEETIGRFIYDLGNKQWDIPALRELLEQILPQETVFNDFEVRHTFPLIGPKTMLLNARQVIRKEPAEKRILLAIEDITERKLAEERLQRFNVTLEQQVEQRTAELSDSNESLRREVQRHVSTIEELNITSEEFEKMNKEYREIISRLQGVNEDLNVRVERISERNKTLASQSNEYSSRLEELSDTETFFKNLLDSLPMGLAVLDDHLRILTWNAAAERLWGRERGSMLRLPVYQIFDEESETHLRREIALVKFGKKSGGSFLVLQALRSDETSFACRVRLYTVGKARKGPFLLLFDELEQTE